MGLEFLRDYVLIGFFIVLFIFNEKFLCHVNTKFNSFTEFLKDTAFIELLILYNLYKCEGEFPKLNLYDHSSYNVNGGVVGNDNTKLLKTEEKFQKYGILQNNFMTLFFEELLWYNCITLFGMTIVYILFLRKAVYDI